MNFVVSISFLSPRMLIAIKWESTIMSKQHHHFASLNFVTLIEGNSSSNCIYLPLIVYSLTRCQNLLEIASLSMGILEEITCMPFNQFRKEYGQFLFSSRIWVFFMLCYTVFYSQILNNFTMVMANSKAFATLASKHSSRILSHLYFYLFFPILHFYYSIEFDATKRIVN